MTSRLFLLAPAISIALLSGCAIGPDYQRPQTAAPLEFKQAAGWTQANPSDSLARGAWWELYGDPQLNRWIDLAVHGSPSMAEAAARVREARAMAGLAESAEAVQINGLRSTW